MPAETGNGEPMCTAKHSEETYWGRVLSVQQRMSPKLLLASRQEVQNSKRVAALADAGAWSELRAQGITDETLQQHVLLRNACINPSNGNEVPLALRLAAFPPVNIPICAGLLLSSSTVVNSVFWQWVNQTYNAAFNYANGNLSQDREQKERQKANLLKGYSAAVVVSVGLAVGLNTWLRNLNVRPTVLKLLQGTVPFTAVAGANIANIFCMRGQECIRGIPVSTESGKSLGVSKRAGFEAVMQTAISRIVLPLPVLLLPSQIISLFSVALPMSRSTAFRKIVTDLSIIYGCLSIGLPLAMGIFPSTVRFPVSCLEPEFQGLRDEDGTPITYVVFNRGI